MPEMSHAIFVRTDGGRRERQLMLTDGDLLAAKAWASSQLGGTRLARGL